MPTTNNVTNNVIKIETTPELVAQVYQTTRKRLEIVRDRLKRPLTLAEKILFGHLDDPQNQELVRGQSFLNLRPDRVAMQDATAQMAILQFMLADKDHAAVPSTVHCDHLITARAGKTTDLSEATKENEEVYNFLASASSRYNLGFWRPGAGIIHQVILENYAFPGGLMIGTDSHTPNAGGLGLCAVGVGGSDASDVMVGLPWEVKNPKIIGVRLKGKLNGWTSGKDVILKLLGMLTVQGGTDKIVEYIGGEDISCTGKATIANMGAELGATCSLFAYDSKMGEYLKSTNRKELADLAEKNLDILSADKEVLADPAKYYDEYYEIDLSTLEPHLVGPHSPDIARPISQIAKEAKEKGWPTELSAALVGSCTNSSYEDLGRATFVAKQALNANIKMKQPFFISPGSTQIQKTIERDGQMEVLKNVGATILANACGPCIGQWKREEIPGAINNKSFAGKNTIVTTFNRNFRGRNDGNPETLAFIGSPELVMALGLAGKLDFNPLTDKIDGTLKLSPPVAPELPSQGFVTDTEGYQQPQGRAIQVQVDAKSERLQLLKAFEKWSGQDFTNQVVLAKVKGKCTTDHISPGGKWLKYRGHLDKISDNMLLGADNAFTGESGKGHNVLAISSQTATFAQNARNYQAQKQGWIIVGDENYGEGSSREHAAMSPRYLGCTTVIAKSFARIHETNLKKQGVLALHFADSKDWSKIREDDRVNVLNLSQFSPGKHVTLELVHSDGSKEKLEAKHTYNSEQIKWFKAGSALNSYRNKLQ